VLAISQTIQGFIMHRLSLVVPFLALTGLLLPRAALAQTEVVASESQTVQPSGPRTGDAGKKYFNVEGKDNDKFASFGVLVFELPKDVQGKAAKSMKLTLVQSTPKFAKAGAIKLFLAPKFDAKAELKFDPKGEDGVGKQIEPLLALGSGDFKDPEPGRSQSFSLTLTDPIRDRIAKGGKLHLVIVPADASVAATYFGAEDEAQDKRPKLTLELP
jgi:hypothetical protein